MSLKRFTSVKNLRGLGRPLLKEFFNRFEEELRAKSVTLPAESLEDDPYFKALADVFFAPKELPEAMTRVLEAVLELADDKGVADLTKAAKEKNLPIDWTKKRTNLDTVMQVWLADADLMTKLHNEHRLMRTTRFQYWGTKTPPADRMTFTLPTDEAMELVRKTVDEWCVENHRGENTVVVCKYELDGEWWFLIQHGGMMSRLAEAKGDQKTETLFYRPGKDDMVVYNVERDEIRIHTASKAEWELYRKEFGLRLRGDPEYFSDRKHFVLDPLRKDVDMGTSQRRGLGRLGSVSRAVVHYAHMNVACVPVPFAGTPPASGPQFERVLVPLDFSESDEKAVALAFASVRPKGEVRLVHVTPRVRRNGHTTRRPECHVESSQDFSARMEALVPKAARGGGIRTRAEVVEHNEPALAICQIADQFDADLICMAARKRPWLRETLYGSVSKRVMVRSGRPVLITRSPGREPGEETLVETLTKNGG